MLSQRCPDSGALWTGKKRFISSFVSKLDLLRQCLFPVAAAIPLAPATLGAPLGDGLSNALASQEIAAFDALALPSGLRPATLPFRHRVRPLPRTFSVSLGTYIPK